MTEREQVRLQKIEDTKIKIVVSHVFVQGSILDHLILFITNIDRKNLRSLKRFQIFFLGQSLTFLLNRQAGLLQNLTVLSEDFITIMYTRTYSLRTNNKNNELLSQISWLSNVFSNFGYPDFLGFSQRRAVLSKIGLTP